MSDVTTTEPETVACNRCKGKGGRFRCCGCWGKCSHCKGSGRLIPARTTTEQSVEDCLRELIELFPRDLVQMRMFGSRDGIVWTVTVGDVVEPTVAEETLSDCMSQVRAWHKEQKGGDASG